MAKVLTPIKLANTLENGKMTKRMVMVLKPITMGQNIKENIKMIRNMVKELKPLTMGQNTKENGKMT